jgi:hypothetical protein
VAEWFDSCEALRRMKTGACMRFVLVWILLLVCTKLPGASARQTSSLQAGYIRLIPDNGTSSPAGVAILRLQSAGNVIAETAVPSTTPVRSGRIFVDIDATLNTGIALANPNNQDATISYYFTNSSGSDFEGGTFVLSARHQIATFLTQEPFGLISSFTGTFTFSSSHPVAAVGLRNLVNERNEALITTMPVSALGSGFGGTALLIPRFPGGDGWTTQVVLVNPGDTVLTGVVVFYEQGSGSGYAAPLQVVVNGVASPIFFYTVPPRSALRMLPVQAASGDQIGSVRIVPSASSGTPSSLAISSYRRAGVTVSTASVPALPAGSALRMYIETSGVSGQAGSIQTGMSISNPSYTGVTVQMKVMNLDGTWSGLSTSVNVPPVGQIYRFANELFPQLPPTFKGVVAINAPTPLVIAGLRGRYNSRGDLLITSTPPYDDASAPLQETIFPHFISGSGYSTQLILLSTGLAHTGSLSLISQDGTVLPASSLQPGS